MAGWQIHHGLALALARDNIDTDQLIPARFMSVPRDKGYGDYLLHDLRRDAAGALDPDFALNRHSGVSVLVTGRNFGSGSSREAAVYALVDAGFRVVIAPGFGDIFAANAVNNGLLPARVSPEDAAVLMRELGHGTAPLTISLETCDIQLGTVQIDFALDDSWRTKLINGWDDIDLTQVHRKDIERFQNERQRTMPWVWPKAVRVSTR